MSDISTVAHVIQLAVAPVFLLTGVGAILSVLTSRLGRIVDRFRMLERSVPGAVDEIARHKEMSALARREQLIYWAIGLCTIAALLVCVVIATLFVGSMLGAQMSSIIALLFILSMFSLIAGLISFLREIQISTGTIHRMVK